MALPSQAFHKERKEPRTQAERDEIAKDLHPASVPGNAVHDLTRVDFGDVLVFDTMNNGRYASSYAVQKREGNRLFLPCGMVADARTGRVEGYSHAVVRLPKTGEVEGETRKSLVGRLLYFDYERLSIKKLQYLNEMLDRYAEDHREYVKQKAEAKASEVPERERKELPDTRRERERARDQRDEDRGRVRRIGDDDEDDRPRRAQPRREIPDDEEEEIRPRKSMRPGAPVRVQPRVQPKAAEDDDRPRTKRRYTYEED